jgi:predicted helicase
VASAGWEHEPIDWRFQDKAVASAIDALREYPRTTIVAACGSGKNKVGAKIVAKRIGHLEDSHTLILAPNLDLLTQLIEEYEQELPPGLLGSIVAVCSELRVDADAISRTDLQARDVEVTTSASRLAEILAAPGRFTVFATYASQLTIRSAHRHCGLKRWDFALIDEAHRSAGAVDREWSTILHDRNIPCAERLFMTATPRIISREGTVSMDDAKVFGRICFEFTAEHARQAGVQATPRVLVPVLTDKDVYALTAGAPEDAAHLSIHDSLAMDPGKLAVQIAVLKAAREFNLTRLISFHSRIPDARAWSRTLQHANALLPEDERLPAVTGLHISGQHKPTQRTTVYNRLKSNDTGLVVVSNAKVMGEGVNVPNVDGVVFVDPKNSFEAVVQAVGRALRTNGDRHKIATIIVPILLAEGQTPESALEGSAFNTVWTTLCALAAHDVAFRGELAHHRFEMGHSDEAAPPPITLPDWLTFTGAAVPDGFASAISVRAVQMTTDAWEERLGKVARYYERNGHLLPTTVEDFTFQVG